MACQGCVLGRYAFAAILSNEEALLSFLRQHGVLPTEPVVCPKCIKPCTFYPENSYRYKCTNYNEVFKSPKKARVQCDFSVSAKKGTFFENSKLSIETICRFVDIWLDLVQPKHEYMKHELGLADHTVVDWSNFCREVCLVALIDESEPLGGEGKIVEVHEAKMGKRKYNRGRVIDGQWIFGGIERGTKRSFFVVVPDRSKETLLAFTKKWVLPGTIITSDRWKAYDCLAEEGFQHFTVNHSHNFVDPETGAHTHTIERQWREVRANILKFGRKEEHFPGYLAECFFRRKYPDHRDRYHHFFKCVASVYPPWSGSGNK